MSAPDERFARGSRFTTDGHDTAAVAERGGGARRRDRVPEFAAPRRFYATTGISVTRDGVDHSEDVTLAARNALLNTIDHLTERGWSRQQAYAICSVAVDLKISQLVDVPNMLVSAFLPEDIFTA
jgi:formamidase